MATRRIRHRRAHRTHRGPDMRNAVTDFASPDEPLHTARGNMTFREWIENEWTRIPGTFVFEDKYTGQVALFRGTGL